MSGPSLAVLYGTRVVATLTQEPNGTLALEYLPDIVARVPEGTPLISIALPVRSVPYRGDPVRAFCDGLLPEGEVRERLAGRLGLSTSNTFGLLEAFGRDCAGALSLVPEAQALAAAAPSSVEWLDEAELATRVREALPESMEWAATQGLSTRLLGQVRALAERRSIVLERVRSLAAPDSPELRGREDQGPYPRRRAGSSSWPKPPGS